MNARVAVVCFALFWAGAALGETWEMAGSGSRLEFTATYQGEPLPGEFRQFDTSLVLDPEEPGAGKLRVTVDIASVDLGSPDLEEGVATGEWFDTRRYPAATFTSRAIRQTAPGKFIASGTLELKGVRRKISVPFAFTSSGQHAAMTGALRLKRTVFGIGAGEWAADDPIGFEVRVAFKVSLRRAH